MKDLADVFHEYGFTESKRYYSEIFNHVFEKDNLLFYLKYILNAQELASWEQYQSEINAKAFSVVPDIIRYNIYFILLLKFSVREEDQLLLNKIEIDRYFCRKILIQQKTYDLDLWKLPFMEIPKKIYDKKADEIESTLTYFISRIEPDQSLHRFIRSLLEKSPEKIFENTLSRFKTDKK